MNISAEGILQERGYLQDYIRSYGEAATNSGYPMYRDLEAVRTLTEGLDPEREIMLVLKSGLLKPAEYRAIEQGYSGTGANEGISSDRRNIVSMAKYLREGAERKELKRQQLELKRDMLSHEKERRKKSGLGYRFDPEQAGRLLDHGRATKAFKDYILGSDALSYMSAVWEMAKNKPNKEEIRNSVRLMSYLKGSNVERAAIVKDIFDALKTLDDEELQAVGETGLYSRHDLLGEAFNDAYTERFGSLDDEDAFEAAHADSRDEYSKDNQGKKFGHSS